MTANAHILDRLIEVTGSAEDCAEQLTTLGEQLRGFGADVTVPFSFGRAAGALLVSQGGAFVLLGAGRFVLPADRAKLLRQLVAAAARAQLFGEHAPPRRAAGAGGLGLFDLPYLADGGTDEPAA